MNKVGNTGLSIVSNKYAMAMIEIAEKNGILDEINTNLALIKEIVNSNSELKEFLGHPLIKNEDKKEVLEKIFKEEVCAYSMNLVKLLADRKRLIILPFIFDYYNKILCKIRNMGTAQVITAVQIDEAMINRVKEKLEKMFSRQIKIKSMVDKEIIAGMVIKIDDKVIDGSIRNKLEEMKKQLC